MRNYKKKDTKRVLTAFENECLELCYIPRIEKLDDTIMSKLNKTYLGLNNGKPLTKGFFTVEEDGALSFTPEKVREARSKIVEAGKESGPDKMLIIKEQVMHDLRALLTINDEDFDLFSPYDENGERKSKVA